MSDISNTPKFTHLHFHTEYSLLDGANKIKDLPKKLKELGMDSIAITDHGNMFGAIEFYSTMRKNDIKPIIGMEGYIHNGKELETDKTSKTKDERFHICLYAKNEIGYKNLMYLSSVGYTHGFYSKPRINKETLKKHSEGLICTSACLNGEVSYHLVKSSKKRRVARLGYEHAKKVALEYKEIFGDDFYLELMRHGIAEQRSLEEDMFKLSHETGIKIVATNDTHYSQKQDAENHEVYMCIGMGKTFDDPNRMKHSVTEFYIKSAEEMSELFADIPEAIEMTQEIVNKCNLEIKLGDPTPPNFKFTIDYANTDEVELPEPENRFSLENDKKYFEFKCWQGLEKRLEVLPESEHENYKKRLELEVETINTMKFPGYMLIVWDFIRESEKEGIPIGPGRGCLTKEALIYTVNLETFNINSKNINNIQKDDLVITHNNKIKQVSETFEYEIDEELFQIDTFYGDLINPIILTKDHKIYLGDNKWKEAQNIEETDYLYLPIPEIPSKLNITNEVAKYLFDQTESDNLLKIDSLEKAYEIRLELLKAKIPSELKELKNNNISEFIISIPKKLSKHKQFEIHKHHILLKVKKITKLEKTKTKVYDFTVDDDHSYTTTNYTVHNSAAGSLVAYSLRITDIDPIKYSLLFERFLNPERVSLPDIDMDFSQNERGKIIDYVQRKYGREHVAQVVTFNSLLAKGVVRDVARVMDYPYNQSNEFAKLIPNELKITLKDAIEKEPKITENIKLDQTNKLSKIWDYSVALEGLKRNTGVHAAGVVIHNEPIWANSPVCTTSKDRNQYITQYSLNYLEDVDLIKFDFLGLKTLDVIHNAIKLIKKNHDIEISNWHTIDINDPETYKNLSDGNTIGVFQLESEGMQKLNKRLKPSTFEDVIAVLALYRPGPMESGMLESFVRRKNGQEEVDYFFDEMTEILKPILSNTYGVIVYQEQVMQIVREVGGFSLGRSDLVRRAMGKKKFDEMQKYKAEFREGAEKKGLNGENAEKLFDLIEKFAGYGFNKSHSAAYAFITFQTAYLKTHFPTEFMASLLTSDKDNTDKVVRYVEEAERLNIKISPPDVKLSDKEFTPIFNKKTQKSSIVFGLSGIKGVGDSAVEDILKTENRNKFNTIEDFLKNISSKVNKKVLESLIKAGGFRNFKQYNKRTLLDNVELLVEFTQGIKELESNSGGLFDDDEVIETEQELRLNPLDEYPKEQILEYEKETLGFYVSGHPLDDFKEQINSIKKVSKIKDMEKLGNGTTAFFIGKLEILEEKISKSGNPFAPSRLSDFTGNINITLFKNNLEKVNKIKEESNDFALKQPIGIKGRIEKDIGENNEISGIELRIFEIVPFDKCEETAQGVRTSFKDSKKFLEKQQQDHKNRPHQEQQETENKNSKTEDNSDFIFPLSLNIHVEILQTIKKEAELINGNNHLKFLISDEKYRNQQILIDSNIKVNREKLIQKLEEIQLLS